MNVNLTTTIGTAPPAPVEGLKKVGQYTGQKASATPRNGLKTRVCQSAKMSERRGLRAKKPL
jgi:hypothetical protein